jgi:TatD DNase family protein
MPHYFDAHTHAHFAAFENDSKEVIDRALASDVWMVNVGTQRDTSRRGVEVARLYEQGVYAAVGLHPVHTDRSFHDAQELGASEDAKGFTSRGEEFDYDYYLALGRDPKVVAIGECGLDYFRIEGTTEEVANKKVKQKIVFEAQVKLAGELQKPLMIHCRDAFSDVITILRQHGYPLKDVPAGVIHFFTGSVEDAQQFLELGFGFTFGGVVTFPPKKGNVAGDYDEVIKMIPIDKIFSETDAPYVAPMPYRGKRNEPVYVIETVKKLAELKGVSLEDMKAAIFKNAQRIFGI